MSVTSGDDDVMNFESVYTYFDVVLIFGILLSGTYLYTLRDLHEWLAPYIVLFYGFVLLTIHIISITIVKGSSSKKQPVLRPKTLLAGWIWLFWIIYGIVFKEISPAFPVAVGYIQSAVVVGFVMLSYIKLFQDWHHLIFAVVLLLLVVPHADSISHHLDPLVLYVKLVLFYVLYVLSEMWNIVSIRKGKQKINDVTTLEYHIVRSCWVLLTSKYLIVFSLFQIIPITYQMFHDCVPEQTMQALPVVDPTLQLVEKPIRKKSSKKLKAITVAAAATPVPVNEIYKYVSLS